MPIKSQQIVDTLKQTCETLFAKKQVVELRVLGIPGRNDYKFNAAGWFDNWDLLAEAAIKYEKRNPSGIYVTINALHPACLARTNNAMKDRIRDTSSDRDIVHRNWLPIDLDPIRPSGVSATTGELTAARSLTARIVDYLEDLHHWTTPLKAHSGNGIHLLYKIDLDNTDTARDLVKAILKQLSKQFDNTMIQVDKGLHNAARILKLHGTVARKGQHTHDRPHRRSRLWNPGLFAEIKSLSQVQLERFLETAPKIASIAPSKRLTTKRPSQSTRTPKDQNFDLASWITRNQISFVRTESFDGSGIKYILSHCLFDDSHTGTSAVVGQTPNGAVFYKCQHESCTDRKWADARALFIASEETSISDRIQDGPEGENSLWELAGAYVDEEYSHEELGGITLRRHRQSWFIYDTKLYTYTQVSHDRMLIAVTRWLGENGLKTTTRQANDMLNSIQALVTVAEEVEMPHLTRSDAETRLVRSYKDKHNWVALENGILDLDGIFSGKDPSNCLMNHTATWFSTTVLSFPFPTTPIEATCSEWVNFLEQILENDQERIKTVQEMFGYCFYRDTLLEKFFILHGRGNNGKSTLLNILSLLLGKNNVSSLSLDQLNDRTLRTQIYNKLANICHDLPEMDRVEEGLIKRITSGEEVTADRKYKDPLAFKPTLKLIFATNPLPRFADTSLGIWRRMMVIPFEYIVPPEDIDIQLLSRLIPELPGIFVWALDGAIRLAKNRQFTDAKSCKIANITYKMSCFPVYTFLDECTIEEGRITTRSLWEVYRLWCKEYGLTRIKPLGSFIRDVIDFMPKISYPRVPHHMIADIELKGINIRPNLTFGNDFRETDFGSSGYAAFRG